MANNRNFHAMRSTAIAMLLVVQVLLLAVTATAAPPNHTLSDSQQTAIAASLGPGAPYGPLQSRDELAAFYFHTPYDAATGSGANLGDRENQGPFPMDLRRPTQSAGIAGDQVIVIGTGDPSAAVCAPFTGICVGTPLQVEAAAFLADMERAIAVDSMQVKSFEASVHIAGLAEGGQAYAVVYLVDSTGERVDTPPLAGFTLRPVGTIQGSSGATTGPVHYYGVHSLGSDGITLAAGHSFEVVVGTSTAGPITQSPNVLGTPAYLFLDSVQYPSYFAAKTDSARISAWTETTQRQLSNAFGSANINANTPANLADRQFLVHVVQASAWGADMLELPGRGADSRHDIRLRYMDAVADQGIHQAFPDFFTGPLATPLQPNGARQVPVPGTDGSVEHRVYHFVYPSGFDANGIPRTQDGSYRIEVRQAFQGWDQIYEFFTIGSRGFTFRLAEGENSTHEVLPGELTRFVFRLNNTSPASDLIAVAPAITGGWTATLSSTRVPLVPHDSQMVFLDVLPPANAKPGDQRLITVSAVSLISNDIKSLQVLVEVVGDPLPGVELHRAKPGVETRPGITDSSFVQIRNIGNAADRFIITHRGAPPGWDVSLTPPIHDIYAASRTDALLQITAPVDANSGDAFTLTLSVVSVADDTIAAVMELPVTIYNVRGILVDATETLQYVRNPGPLKCSSALGVIEQSDPIIFGCLYFEGTPINPVEFTDTEHDRSLLSRFRVSNVGDLDEEMIVRGYWVRPTEVEGATDLANCRGEGGGSRDGIPDGWNFNVDPVLASTYPPLSGILADTSAPYRGDASTRTNGFSGLYNLGTLSVPAGAERDFYMEFGWATGDVCPTPDGSQPASMTAEFIVQVTLEDDPSVVVEEHVRFERQEHGGRLKQNVHNNSLYDVGLSPGANSPVDGFVLRDSSIDYHVIARNSGNEPDRLSILVAPGKEGWDHEILWAPASGIPNEDFMFNPWGPATIGHADPDPLPQAACRNPALNLRGFNCYMGIHDEVHFTVRVTPPANARIGDFQTAAVQVVSGKDGNVFDSLVLTTTVSAPFAFQPEGRVNTLTIEPGGTAAFPYSVHNQGLGADSYLFKVVEGPDNWIPRVSELSQVFVPSGLSHHGFLSVRAPETAVEGSVITFRVEVENIGIPTDPADNQRKTVEFFARVVPKGQLTVSASPAEVRGGSHVDIDITAVDNSDGAAVGTFSIDPDHLPRGWTVVCYDDNGQGTQPAANGEFGNEEDDEGKTVNRAEVTCRVTAPTNELSTSRIALRVNVTTEDEDVFGFTDLLIDLSSVFGLSMTLSPQDTSLVVPGKSVERIVRVQSHGLSWDTITLNHGPLPEGWAVHFVEPSFTLQPLDVRDVSVLVTAPAGIPPGTASTVLVLANSVGDTSKSAQLTLRTEVGLARLEVSTPEGIQYLAPEETGSFVVRVHNNGTLFDTVRIRGELGEAYGTTARLEPRTEVVNLRPGEAKSILVDFTMPRMIAPGSDVPVNIIADSAFEGVIGVSLLTARILDYVAQDVDGDGLDEYAVSSDRNDITGFNEYRESRLAGGLNTVIPDLARFLTPEASAAKTVNGELRYFIDGDGDGRADHFLDTNGDGLPNLYWDPDRRHVTRLDIAMDVTGNGVREYFIDVDGDGLLDVWFDLTTGEFGKLIQVDLDGDGIMDYVVDLNGNGRVDTNEPVLYGRTGGIVAVRMIDVTGNGCLDQVFFLDGSNDPQYFVAMKRESSGACVPGGSIPIVLEDVTGDRRADWTFDSTGDGKRDSYYDPHNGRAGTIDKMSVFARSLVDHWYIGALFLLVAALFVTLLAVTRRS